MRSHTRALTVAVLLTMALAIPSIAGAGPTKRREPWEGFGVGTSITVVSKSKTVIVGAPAIPDTVEEERRTLVKITDLWYVVLAASKVDGKWDPGVELPFPRGSDAEEEGQGVTTEDLGAEKVSIEGKEYACKKRKQTVPGTTLTSWVHAEHGILKSESTTPNDVAHTMTVTSLAKSVSVSGKVFVCRESRFTSKSPRAESTTVRVESDAVPGHIVRSEMVVRTKTATSESSEEVVAVELK